MNLSILYSVFIVFFLLLLTDSIDLNQQCPTSRRLLLFSSLKLPFGEKKSSSPSRHTSQSITYIQPQTSQELGRKVRSYTHLLKPKLFTNAEKLQLKQSQKLEKKKATKKKDTIEHAKTKDLIVPINKQEIDRCRSLLQLDEKKTKKIKRDIPTKVKNATNQPVKIVKKKVDSVPTTESKVKSTKKIVKIPSKPLENLKYKASKPETITIIEQIRTPFDEQNDSAVNRAFYFVRNMFQLSEPSSDESQLDDDPIIDITSEQQQTLHQHSRKLLSISEYQYPTFINLPKRQLLATKSKSAAKQKNKTSNSKNESKPKVGWAYRYRISRYLDAQKSKHKRTGREKKSSQSIPKRKLLQFDGNDDNGEEEEGLDLNKIYRSDQNSINTVTIMTSFVPKRQLLTTKSKATHDIDVDKKKKDKHVDPIAIVPSDEQDSQKPRVGWEFRYRVSKYMDSLQASINADQERLKSDLHKVKQKRKVAKSSVSQTVDNEQLQAQQDAALDPELAQINDEGRKVGWAYRYRIRRKLDHLKAIEAETGVPFDLATLSGKREKKANATKPKAKAKTNLKKKNPTTPVPPSEQNKKADALQQAAAAAANRNVKHPKKTKKKVIKNTDSPSITRFISTLASKAKNSVCFLPGPNLLPFCSSENTKSTAPNKTVPRVKKLRMRTENRAKQFIHARITKLGAHDKATERRVDEQMKRLYKKPSYPPIQKPPPSSTVDSAAHSSKSHEHVEKVIAVDSKKAQNKKKNQIIGQEVPIKPKHASPPTTTTTSEPVTPSVPLRSIAEVIKQEAATILKSDRKESQTPEEIQYEINETKEVVREQKLLKATPAAKSTSLNDTENATQT